MKKNLLISILCLAALSMQAQNVPNGGFETWTSGNPNNWLVNNIPSIAIPITQVTPAHGGALALKGEVVTSPLGDLAPLAASTDMSGNGFTISQAYSTLSFYYKTSLAGNATFDATVVFYDAANQPVAGGYLEVNTTVGAYTLASIPLTYFGTDPVEAIIAFTINDTVSGTPALGNYYIVDDVALTGLVSVQEPSPALSIENIYPNPSANSLAVGYNLSSKSDVNFHLLNAQGKVVREAYLSQESAGKHELKFDVSSLPAGVYIMHMKTNQGVTANLVQIAR